MKPPDWGAVRESLRALTEVCEAEQQAVVAMDADRVAALTPRKRQMVTELGERFSLTLQGTSGWPGDVAALALRCRAINRLTHKLLAISVRRMNALLRELGVQADAGYGTGYAAPRRGRLELRV